MTPSAFCFVMMPFGTKTDSAGTPIDFDLVYRDLVQPAIRAASLEPLRADQEVLGGLIHRSIFEKLVLCKYAIVDLTAANPNVFYELGVRHALRPSSTVLILAEGQRAPFDIAFSRFLTYSRDPSGQPRDPEFPAKLAAILKDGSPDIPDSPVFQTLPNLVAPTLTSESDTVLETIATKTDGLKKELSAARHRGIPPLLEFQNALGDISKHDSGIVTDLFLSYREVKGWAQMIALVDNMSPALRSTDMVQQQLALALNRAGNYAEAESVLRNLLATRGPSSETYGILGRIYKDQWDRSRNENDTVRTGLLDKAINAYLGGFETDWRDAYPGVNAATLMTLRNPPDRRLRQILPVVQYCVERTLASGKTGYWDYATRLELAVLSDDEHLAIEALEDTVKAASDDWETETTARNLRLIREAREKRNEDSAWLLAIENRLKGESLSSPLAFEEWANP